MTMLFFLLSLLLVLLAAAAVAIHRDRSRNHPPGPLSIPLLGSLEQRNFINCIAHQEFERLGKKHGDLIFFRLFMDQPLLIVRGFRLISEAMHSRAYSGVGKALTFKEHGLYRRRGLIFSEGDNWHEMRRFVVRTLHSQGFGRKERTDNINDEFSEVLKLLEAAASGGREVSALNLFTAAAANSLLQLVAGQKLSRDGQLDHLTQLVDRNVEALGPAYIHLDLFPWLRYVAPERSGYRQFKDDVHELLNLFQPVLNEPETTVDDADDSAPPRHLIKAFLREQRQGKSSEFYNEENLRGVLKDLFMAGMETTSTVMGWMTLMLVQYPDVQARAAAEVDELIGRDRSPSIDDMQSLPYLDAVVEETLRYKPPIPVVQHATSFGATRLDGYYIPAHCRVLFDLHSVMHDKTFWGDPEVFRPERFLGADAARLRKRMLSFGLGSRHCIGEAHARQSVFLFTTGLLQRFRLKLCPGQDDILDRLVPNLIMKPNDFRFTLEARQ